MKGLKEYLMLCFIEFYYFFFTNLFDLWFVI